MSERPTKGLGMGLQALLGEAARSPGPEGQVESRGGVREIEVSRIQRNPEQPRVQFDEASLEELAQSIRERGVLQPILLREVGDSFMIIAGERRWRAAQRAQLHTIPAIVRDIDESTIAELALIENIQREDLNPVEEARAYHRLAEEEGLTQAEIARLVEKSRSHVANFQRLLTLPAGVIAHLDAGRLSMGHARALIGHERAAELADEAVAKGLSVREVERLARKAGAREPAGRKGDAAPRHTTGDADIAAVQNHLEEFLGLPVRINTDADPRSGAVTIRYRTLDQLDLICQRLTGGGI